MAAQREWTLRHGEPVYLRTAPVDPRDLFRGDYVRLDYEVSTLPGSLADSSVGPETLAEGGEVFVRLGVGEDGLARAEQVSVERPEAGLYLEGMAEPYRHTKEAVGALRVRYGIEKYFVEQGKGLAMEERRGGRNDVQVPLEMRVAVGARGLGVISGHRWSRLGIGLTLVREVPENAEGEIRNAVMQLTLKNVSGASLTLVILPDQCSFSLESSRTAPKRLRATRPECAGHEPAPEHARVLGPEESLRFDIDLNDPRWQVSVDGAETSIGTLPWNQRFRLIYRSLAVLRDGDHTWVGELPSRAFHGRGWVD
jgi:uncharacterized membrane-anchored protein